MGSNSAEFQVLFETLAFIYPFRFSKSSIICMVMIDFDSLNSAAVLKLFLCSQSWFCSKIPHKRHEDVSSVIVHEYCAGPYPCSSQTNFSLGINTGCVDIIWSTPTYCPGFVKSSFISSDFLPWFDDFVRQFVRWCAPNMQDAHGGGWYLRWR